MLPDMPRPTLVETATYLTVAGLCAVVLWSAAARSARFVGNLTGSNQKAAASLAGEWATNLQHDARIDCSAGDSDLDGYVSCSVFEQGPDGVEVHAIECAGAWTILDGCRAMKMQVARSR